MELYFSVPDMPPCIMLGTGAALPLCRYDYVVNQNVELLQHMMYETIKQLHFGYRMQQKPNNRNISKVEL
jgi:hypothetical protein